MDEAAIYDLKQFIHATVSHEVSSVKHELNQFRDEFHQRFELVDRRFNLIEQRFDDLELVVRTVADAHAETLDNHELRIGRFEGGSSQNIASRQGGF